MISKIVEKIKYDLFQDKEFKLVFSGSAKTFAMKIGGLAVGYIFTIVIAKNFGAELLGNFLLSLVILNFVSVLIGMGLDTTVVAFVSKFNAQKKTSLINQTLWKSYSLIILIGIFLTVLIVVSSDIISGFFFDNLILSQYLVLLTFCAVPITLVRFNSHFLRGLNKITEFAIFNHVLINLLSLIAILIFMVISDDPKVVALSILLGVIAAFVFSTIYIIQYIINSNNGKSGDSVSYQSLLSYSFPIMSADILKQSRSWISILLIGYFLTEADVGVFGIVIKLAVVPSFLIVAVNAVVMPKFSEFAAVNDTIKMQSILRKGAKIIFWTGIPSVIAILILSAPLLKILGDEFTTGMLPLMILLVGQLFEIVAGTANYILQMVGKQKVHLVVMTCSTILLIFFSIIFIPSEGIIGAAIAVSVSIFTQSLILIYYIKFNMKLKSYYMPFISKI